MYHSPKSDETKAFVDMRRDAAQKHRRITRDQSVEKNTMNLVIYINLYLNPVLVKITETTR